MTGEYVRPKEDYGIDFRCDVTGLSPEAALALRQQLETVASAAGARAIETSHGLAETYPQDAASNANLNKPLGEVIAGAELTRTQVSFVERALEAQGWQNATIGDVLVVGSEMFHSIASVGDKTMEHIRSMIRRDLSLQWGERPSVPRAAVLCQNLSDVVIQAAVGPFLRLRSLDSGIDRLTIQDGLENTTDFQRLCQYADTAKDDVATFAEAFLREKERQ